jgi:uncharacterized membrane protein YfcA
MAYAWLALIVFIAFGLEAALGFGCTILAVTVGVHLFPMAELLPVLVALNMVVSLCIVSRHFDAIDHRLLCRRILPLMALGIPVGMLVFHVADGPLLKLVFGLFVIVVSGTELLGTMRGHTPAPGVRPLSGWQGAGLLLAAGLTHGLYASGGPLAVDFTSRQPLDKRSFRSTMSALWIPLNLMLLIGYAAEGSLETQTARVIGWMMLPLVAGVWGGEWLHSPAAGVCTAARAVPSQQIRAVAVPIS